MKARISALSLLVAGSWLGIGLRQAVASPESRRLLAEGASALDAGRAEEALSRFEEAARADPLDPEVLFEKGRAHFRLGQWYAAAGAFERYEQAGRRRAATSAYLGRAYLLLDDYARAELNLKEAVNRDPSLEPSVKPFLDLIVTVRQDAVQGARLLAALRGQITGEMETDVEREQRAREAERQRRDEEESAAREKEEREQELARKREREQRRKEELRGALREAGEDKAGPSAALRVEAGYNSNAIILGVGRELPPDFSQKHAAFARGGLTLGYGRSRKGGREMSGSYTYSQTHFDGLDELDQADNLLRLDARARLGLSFGAALTATERYTQVGHKPFWNRAAVQPSLLFWHGGVAELSYERAWIDYYPDVAPAFDRDGSADTVALTESWAVLGGKVKPRLGAAYRRNRTDGDDFDSRALEGSAGLSAVLPWNLTVDAAYRAERERFAHGNSQAEPAFSERRKDTVRAIDLAVRRFIAGSGASVFVRYLLTDANSNMRLYHYDQSVSSIGLDYWF